MRLVLDRLYPFFLLLALLIPFLFIDRVTVMITVNSWRTDFWDFFFVKASALGNALTALFLVLLVLRFKLKWLAVFVISFLFHAFLVVLFKKGLFHNELRPYLYFKYSDMLQNVKLIQGVKMRHVNTFPSGHTATIFFLVSYFAILARNKVASWILLFVGFLVGFSRIYLFQHWPLDVYFGVIFGMAASIGAYLLVRLYPRSWHASRVQLNVKKMIRSTQEVFRQLFNF